MDAGEREAESKSGVEALKKLNGAAAEAMKAELELVKREKAELGSERGGLAKESERLRCELVAASESARRSQSELELARARASVAERDSEELRVRASESVAAVAVAESRVGASECELRRVSEACAASERRVAELLCQVSERGRAWRSRARVVVVRRWRSGRRRWSGCRVSWRSCGRCWRRAAACAVAVEGC